jgi:DHA1 family multidrug resistance protein-like MFS transporter
MADIIRDAPIGQLIRWATKNRYLQYPEEKPDFKLPEAWIAMMNNEDTPATGAGSHTNTPSSSSSSTHAGTDIDETKKSVQDIEQPSDTASGTTAGVVLGEDFEGHDMEKVKSIPIVPKRTKDGAILVDWYYSDDAANPHNWSNRRRIFFTTIICLYTFVVYTTSAIYTSSTQGVMEKFGVSSIVATLGLSLYVLGYGVGPLIFSPLSEIPLIGRNPVYIVTMFLFVILSIPTALVNNFPGLMVLRFLQGFFGSPCLASGGASIGDMYSLMALPYAMMAWVSAAYCGRKLLLHHIHQYD